MGERLKVIWGRLREIWPYLAGVFFLLIAGAALKYLPEMQVPKEAYWLDTKTIFDIKNEARRTIAYIIGGLLAVIGIILTFRRIRALEREVQIAQEEQITERFTRAIDQLGSKEMAIRLGGIYALERIANDSDKDYWPIIETLTAYVRENAPWREPLFEEPAKVVWEEAAPPATVPRGPVPRGPQPATDIQAILTVLVRRKYHYFYGENQRLDLRSTDLREVDLINAHLERADLRGAHLEGARLTKAHLEGTLLLEAHLEGAFLVKAHMEETNLFEAHMEETYFAGANLEGAHLRGAHLEGADLKGAKGLTWEQLDLAFLDKNTRLPDYLQEEPPKVKGPEGNDEE